MRSSLRHSGADSTFSPVLWSVSEFKQRLDSSIEASHRAWDGNFISRINDSVREFLMIPFVVKVLSELSQARNDASPKKIIRLRHFEFLMIPFVVKVLSELSQGPTQ